MIAGRERPHGHRPRSLTPPPEPRPAPRNRQGFRIPPAHPKGALPCSSLSTKIVMAKGCGESVDNRSACGWALDMLRRILFGGELCSVPPIPGLLGVRRGRSRSIERRARVPIGAAPMIVRPWVTLGRGTPERLSSEHGHSWPTRVAPSRAESRRAGLNPVEASRAERCGVAQWSGDASVPSARWVASSLRPGSAARIASRSWGRS
jgi:hypothetical protein